jgi:hypothetical protein
MNSRASTCSPINRLGTEYALRSTWIRLPESTFTRSRRDDSMRLSGSSFITSSSSASRCLRPAFSRTNIASRNDLYVSTLAKSTLPRSINSCATARLKR